MDSESCVVECDKELEEAQRKFADVFEIVDNLVINFAIRHGVGEKWRVRGKSWWGRRTCDLFSGPMLGANAPR